MVRDPVQESPQRRHDRVLGAYLGLAIGDALGATVEFMTPREIAYRFKKEGGVHRHIIGGGWLNLKPGQVTDDTTMSLALGQALMESADSGRFFDTRVIAEAYLKWWRGKPVDCGDTCRRGIVRYLRHGSLHGPQNEGDGGNGALMRNLPVVIATLGDEEAFESVSLAQARITHHHPLSDAAVLGLGRLLRIILRDADANEIDNAIHNWIAAWPAFKFHPYPGRASGYVVDTVQTVLHAFTSSHDFETAILRAVNQGEDADTNGALTGMLAGARCGARSLPAHWLQKMDRHVLRAITEQTTNLLALARHRARFE